MALLPKHVHYPAPYGIIFGRKHQLFISASEISASGGYTG
jgi:hypothetical protein